MLPISPNFSPRPSNAQSALGATQDNANAISQDRSDNNFTASGSSLAWSLLTKPLDWVQTVVLPILQQKPFPAEQRWVAWINSRDISEPEQQQRQTLAAKLKRRIQFSGEHIEVRGDLSINLSIKDCPSLTSLPEGLVIEGLLYIDKCPGLTSLPAGLVVKGSLHVSNCPGLTSLPADLMVGDNLWIINCRGLTSLSEGLVIEGFLYIENCPVLISLPAGLVVKGILDVRNCPVLTSLPEGLGVKGKLLIINCRGLTSLPVDLKVNGDLSIWNCSGLTSLPADLVVGGNLKIDNCPGVTSLPLSILQMPPRSDGELREITLENTGITQETRSRIEAWLAEHPNPGLQLCWNEAQADNLDGFAILREALDFRRHRHYPRDP